MKHYLFDEAKDMQKSFNDFVKNIRLTRQSVNVNEYILKNGSIGIFSDNKLPIDIDCMFMNINPFLRRTYSTSLIGTHPYVWILYNFYGEFYKSKNQYYLQKVEEKYYAEILPSLEFGGKIIAFSLKGDYEDLKNRYKEFNYNFVFDVLSKKHLKYKNVNYFVKIGLNNK